MGTLSRLAPVLGAVLVIILMSGATQLATAEEKSVPDYSPAQNIIDIYKRAANNPPPAFKPAEKNESPKDKSTGPTVSPRKTDVTANHSINFTTTA